MEANSTCAETKFEEKCDRLKTILEHVRWLDKKASYPRDEYVSLGGPLLLINQTSGTLARLSRASWVRRGVRLFVSWGNNSSYGVQLCSVGRKCVEQSRNWVPCWVVATDKGKLLDDFY